MEREPGWSSRNERTDVDFDGAVVREDGSCHVVKVTNVSEDGCRIESDRPLSIGEWVTVRIAGRARWRARVRWALMDSAGLEFSANQDFGSSSETVPTS
jgi:hypothetical protein